MLSEGLIERCCNSLSSRAITAQWQIMPTPNAIWITNYLFHWIPGCSAVKNALGALDLEATDNREKIGSKLTREAPSKRIWMWRVKKGVKCNIMGLFGGGGGQSYPWKKRSASEKRRCASLERRHPLVKEQASRKHPHRDETRHGPTTLLPHFFFLLFFFIQLKLRK